MHKRILGLDLGTSGVRGCVVEDEKMLATAEAPIVRQTPADWQYAVTQVLKILSPQLNQVRHIIADATSSTVMLWQGDQPLAPIRMYDDMGNLKVAAALKHLLPPDSGALGATSTLAKVLALKSDQTAPHRLRIAHQIDWLNAQFLGFLPATDWNNALKLGFDPLQLRWPEIVRTLIHPLPLPHVVAPGTPLGTVSTAMQQRWGFPPDCLVHAGTTDSIAAFLACGECAPGTAVTSLGSTLALKLFSEQPVFSADEGVYSHRLPTGWLAGGASNSGGRVLLHYFTLEELKTLSTTLEMNTPSGLDYYPLLGKGERFPIADPEFTGRLTPRPDDKRLFLKGILEGLTEIERRGYARLVALGATAPKVIYCAGGGCQNPAWQAARQRRLPAPLGSCRQHMAAFGVTKLLADVPV